ncbi:MAG TPA: hypothetical protein VF230_02750 [Acidimicrobiales bacterium]
MTVLLIAGANVQLADVSQATNYSGASGGRMACTSTGNTPYNGVINKQDPNPHTFYYSALTDSVRIHQDWAQNSVYGPTSIDTTTLSTASSATDVVVYDENYSTFCGQAWHPQPPNVAATVGLAVCVSLTSANTCEKHEVRYDLSWWDLQVADNNLARRTVSCHEIGHTVGLKHENPAPNTCIHQGQFQSDNINWHDLAHINGWSWVLHTNSQLHLPSQLVENQAVTSPNGMFTLWLQGDGNLVEYGPGCPNNVCWSNGMNNPYANRLTMQSDGNLVQYANDGWAEWPVWATNTSGPVCAGAHFKIQDDGNMVLVAPGDVAKWTRFSGRIGGAC